MGRFLVLGFWAWLAVAQTPLPVVSFGESTPTTAAPGSVVRVVLNATAGAVPITGQVRLSFAPNAALNSDDPSIVFANGSRQQTFVIPPNANGVTLLPFQSGTVAGTITLTVTATAGSVALAPVSRAIVVPRLAPVIVFGPCIRPIFASQFEIDLTGLSVTRDLVSAKVTLTLVSGETATFTFDLSDAGRAYFSGVGLAFGGAFKLQLPFTGDLQEVVNAVVSVSNSAGPSRDLPGGCAEPGQTGLSFTAVEGGAAPAARGLAVLSSAQAGPNAIASPLPFTVRTATTSGGTWLTATPASGTLVPGQLAPPVQVRVDPQGLAPGDYYGTVQVIAPGAPDSPQSTTVVMNVLPAASGLTTVDVLGLVFTAASGGTASPQTVTVTNLGTAPEAVTITDTSPDGLELDYAVSQEPLAAGQARRIAVQPKIDGLKPGVYHSQLQVAGNNVDVRLVVVAGAGKAPVAAAGGCLATQLLPVFTQLGASFSLPLSWPVTLEARVIDDCGTPMSDGSLTASFSNGDPAVPLQQLPDGRWLGTWAPGRGAGTNLTVRLEARTAALAGTLELPGALTSNDAPPVLDASGVLNGATSSATSPAPGGMMAVLGSRLTAESSGAAGIPLPTALGDTRLTLSGRTLPLLSAAEGRIDAVLPFDVPSGANLQLIAQRGNRLSVPVKMSTRSTDPGLFVATAESQAKAYWTDGSGTWLASAEHPAHAGDVLAIYCTGLGDVSPRPEPGAAATGLSSTANTVTVTSADAPPTPSSRDWRRGWWVFTR